MSYLYKYVGPNSIRDSVQGKSKGRMIKNRADLRDWLLQSGQEADACRQIRLTFIVDNDGLRVADRHSEHVQCAGGESVLSAGELCFEWLGLDIIETSNQSTGYCPEPCSFEALRRSVEDSGLSLENKEQFTHEIIFRRCRSCLQRNIVKDHWFECALCGAELSQLWNFAK
jgi:hypothetical protein